MARQDLQNRNLKTHGTPRDQLIRHHSLSRAPVRPTAGFLHLSLAGNSKSAHGLPAIRAAGGGDERPLLQRTCAQPRLGGYGGFGRSRAGHAFHRSRWINPLAPAVPNDQEGA
jgi:hypothetical protein